MEDLRSQQSGENPDVVFCYPMTSYQWKCKSCRSTTRGASSSTLLTSIWLCGPKFLHETFPIQTLLFLH
ncbi:hypothetical protein TNCV_3535561 [Trichonephila clavipes]|nr:hypothetical protein TNCV_3535561 [Trichonephila clavipes]